MKLKITYILFSLVLMPFINYAQNDDQDLNDSTYIEVYLIDSYVKQEPPYVLILSFFTSEDCKSKVIIDGKYEYTVSDTLTEDHKKNIDLAGLNFASKDINFVIVTTDSLGNSYTSEQFDFDLPYEPEIKDGSSLWTLCLFAGSVFLLPAPGYVNADGNSYFSITKELPVVSFRAKKGNYPASYIALEYTHIPKANHKNYFRIGYKRIFPIAGIEYISPGLTAYTNFKGQNGLAPEVSFGLFTLFDTFTLYTRYRFNFKPGDSNSNFHEVNLGLYTRFFSLYF